MGQSNSSEDGGSLEQLPTPTNACPVLVPGSLSKNYLAKIFRSIGVILIIPLNTLEFA